MEKSNIVLIGMPSSGKSTVGSLLAKKTGKAFVDTDRVIVEREKKELREIVNEEGLPAFLDKQDSAVLSLEIQNHVIATGGGIVHGKAAMTHLAKTGIVVYLETELQDIQNRIDSNRRFARNNGQTFEDLYNERVPLYKKYADVIINCSGKTAEDVVLELMQVTAT
ncbi:MAG TPA: shikimate kinase [Clostridia bacterium]